MSEPPLFNLKIVVPSVQLTYSTDQTKKVLRAAATEVASVARRLIRTASGGGRQYGKHTASAPNRPPVSLSGQLADSIHTSVKKRGLSIVARIMDTAATPKGVPYSKFLETGAFGGGGKKGSGRERSHKKKTAQQRYEQATSDRVMAPRPYISNALDMRRDSIANRIREAIDKDIKFQKIAAKVKV